MQLPRNSHQDNPLWVGHMLVRVQADLLSHLSQTVISIG